MLKYIYKFQNIKLLIALLFLISACSIGGKSDPSHFYVLDPIVERVTNGNLKDLIMVVGPITIPGYIDRPQIVTKTKSSELQLAEFDRWAEPMSDMMIRTLAENMKALTGSNSIYTYPFSSQIDSAYQLRAYIIKFENNQDGNARLVVHWQLRDYNESSKFKNFHSEFKSNAIDTSYSSRIAALNDTLAQFAKEVTKHIN